MRRLLRKYISQHCLNTPLVDLSPSLSRCLLALRLLSGGRCASEGDQALVERIGGHFVSTCLEMFLEPAVKSAEFRHSFRQSPLDPHYPFTEAR